MSSGGGFDLLHEAHNRGVFIPLKLFIYCFVAANIAFLTLDPAQTLRNFMFLILISPIWMPLLLARFGFLQWVTANRFAFMARQEWILLELLIPRDIRKTPLAMEAVFTSLHLSPGESTWWKRLVNGAIRPVFSFELVSIGGRVHFYVWARKGFRKGIESAFYAQYPEIQIVEATDYSRLIDPSHAPYDLWGCEYKFTKDADVYPIRTYVDYLKPDSPLAKPEEQVDQLAQSIEFLGSLGPKEQYWMQIMVRVSKNEKFATKRDSHGGPYSIRTMLTEELNKIREQFIKKNTFINDAGIASEQESFSPLTRGAQNSMEAMERKVSKQLFDVGIRAIYTAPMDAYQGINISHLIGFFKPYSSETLNGLGITRWFANFDDWPWEDPHGHHKSHVAHGIVDAYRRRSYFNEPYKMPWMIMNTEELATLYHIPSSGVTTPSLPRIQSSTSEAPSNLPT